jgi:hypothetical protein
MGHWDQADKQYHISRSKYDPEQIKTILDGRAFVEVGKEADNPVIAHNFFSGDQAAPEETGFFVADAAAPESFTIPDTPAGDLPDQFPDNWRGRLEIEMRSRKYSRHTRDA